MGMRGLMYMEGLIMDMGGLWTWGLMYMGGANGHGRLMDIGD